MKPDSALRSPDRIWVPLLLFGAALFLRLLWTWNTHSPTLDTAVVGLMALDIQDGARPMFFTGQGYMGALEAYLTAGMFELFGADRFTMTFAPSVFGAFWPVLVFWILRTRFDRVASVAGAMMTVFPAGYILRYSAVPYGGYPGTYVFGSALMLHALVRSIQQQVHPWKDASLFSLLLFLGVWTNLQIVPYLAAASFVWLVVLAKQWRNPSVWAPFVLAPLAFALALIPQLLLSAQNEASPPLFESLSGEQILRSARALVVHDLPELVAWKDSGEVLSRWTGAFLGGLVLLGCVMLFRKRKSLDLGPLLVISAVFFITFSLLYFPHNMSGFVPRYVIAPFAWGISLTVAGAWTAGNPFRWGVLVLWGGWLGLQALQIGPNMKIQRAAVDGKMKAVDAVVTAARGLDLEVVRLIGSGMEGHGAAAFSFHSRQNPVFVSSYDERRRDADLLWHFSSRAGYYFPGGFEPFVCGSLEAMDLEVPEMVAADRFRVMALPEIPGETSRLEPVVPEPEVVREIPRQGQEILIPFAGPRRVTGLRLGAAPESSLPYQVEVALQDEGGNWQTVARSSRRFGTSYREAGRVFFKGYFDFQDIRWPGQDAQALKLKMTPGRLNKLPVRLRSIRLWVEDTDADAGIDYKGLRKTLEATPDVKVWTPDAWAARLRREGAEELGDQVNRLPLPWNPRDPSAQPPRKELDLAQGVLLVLPQTMRDPVQTFLQRKPVTFTIEEKGGILVFVVESGSSPGPVPVRISSLPMLEDG